MQTELIKKLNSDNKGAKNILVIGVFHGDEEGGEYFINRYLVDAAKNGDAQTINNLYYIPRLNRAKTRVNPNGVDLNRNFPTANWGEDTSLAGENSSDYYGGNHPASEDETKFIVNLMEKVSFDAIITIHSPYKIVNFDGDKGGEAERLSNIVSEIIGYPVQKDIGYPTPGSFGTYAGAERDIPTITIETDENIPYNDLYPKFKELFEFLEFKY